MQLLKAILNSILIILLMTVICSCSPQKWCSEHYPPVTNDSIYAVISYECVYDTIKMPYKEVVFDTTFAFITKDMLFHHSEKRNGLTSTVDINKGKLTVSCAEDSLKQVIENQRKVINTIDQRTRVQMIPCNLEHKTKFNHFCSYWFWITLSIILIWFIFKIIKMYVKV